MADATMERSLAAAIDSSVTAAAGTLIWLVPPRYQHHRFQEQEPPALQLPDDDEGHTTGDVVAALLDEISPRDSDLDEWILGRPTTRQMLLLAMASLQQQFDLQIISQLQAGEAYPNGGFGAVPAAATAVVNLRKQTFDAAGGDEGSADHQSCGITCTCSICLDEFEDGDEISVMPCSGRHEFHTNCITKWLGAYSNMCPLCRHALPTGVDDQ